MPDNLHSQWSDFRLAIDVARRRVFATQKGCWFRGHRDGSWLLRPRLLRYPNGLEREEALFTEFMTRGAEQFSSAESDWDILARMQHHGVPTRLLDWTDRLTTALFFAVTGSTADSRIWILNPFLLCAKATAGEYAAIISFRDDPTYAYSKHFKRNQQWPYRMPVPTASPWKFQRIGQQGGFFTVQGSDPRPLEELAPRFVTSVPIPAELIGYARSRILEDGVDDFAIFSDLDGLGRSIAKKYNMFP